MVADLPVILNVSSDAARDKKPSLLLRLVVFVVLFAIAQTKHLAAGMAGQDAVWPLGFERDHGHIPRLGAVSGRHAATRQPFERFELEHRWRGPYVTQCTCRDRHTAP